mgnify:CR=1 FL=1
MQGMETFLLNMVMNPELATTLPFSFHAALQLVFLALLYLKSFG